MNTSSDLVKREFKQITLGAIVCFTSSLAFASADGCVAPDSVYDRGIVITQPAASCVDVRGRGKRIDSLRGGANLQAGVAVYGSVYITMPNGVAFFTPVELFDNSRGRKVNTKWTTFFAVGYDVPKGQVCAAFYEWTGNQWAAHSPACINVK
jgi:hypothetical protein